MIEAIWSGGQAGADQAGLVAGKALGLITGGYAPKGWQTEDGAAPWLSEYGLVEADRPGYAYRTRLNVEGSDATLMFCTDVNSAGSKLTMELCGVDAELGGERKGKPLFVVEWDEEGKSCNPRYTAANLSDWVRRWVRQHHVGILNVAGNRRSVSPSIEEWVVEFLMETFDQEAWDGQGKREGWEK